MTNVNGIMMPTCAELADILRVYGDQPLYSGNGWFGVVGFIVENGGIQASVKKCPPEGVDAKEMRKAVV